MKSIYCPSLLLLLLMVGCDDGSGPDVAQASPRGTGGEASFTGLDDATLMRMVLAPPVAAGPSHICAVLQHGAVRCWGTGPDGQLGQGLVRGVGDSDTPASAGALALGGPALAIAMGPKHGCATLEGGRLRCWGEGLSGKLGHGNYRWIGDDEAIEQAGDVALDAPVLQVAAGMRHTCALLEGGRVRCWGASNGGQLGVGLNDLKDVLSPAASKDVDAGGPVIALAAGDDHTCALLEGGRVRCWGVAASGRLGLGKDPGYSVEAPAEDTPVGGPVRALTARASRTCALLEGGAVRCWGAGGYGMLGYAKPGDIGDDETPESVGNLVLGEPAEQVSLGVLHGCARLQSGAVRCWGHNILQNYVANTDAQYLGDDESLDSVPAVPLEARATQLASGDLFTCAQLEGGSVRCWGLTLNGSGQALPVGSETQLWPPVALGGPAVQIAAGNHHACALRQDGQVLCWGDGRLLGLGDRRPVGLVIGDDEEPADAPPVQVGKPVVAVAADNAQTCALADDGSVRCWGTDILEPVPGTAYADLLTIGDDEVPASFKGVNLGGKAQQIVAGHAHRCALLTDRTVRCWYEYNGGALGDDSWQPDTIPSIVELPLIPVGGAVVQLAAGDYHTCAVLEGGRVRCWGSGELGHEGIDRIESAQALEAAGDVRLGAPAVQVAAGGDHTCALLDDGRVRCWGDAFWGQTGYASTATRQEPGGDVALGGKARQLVAGAAHTCALLDGGRVRCWGAAESHGIANRQPIGDDEPPVAAGDVSLGEPALWLAAGGWVTCAALAGGRLRCWGFAGFGQLGHASTEDTSDKTPAQLGDVRLGAPLLLP